MKLDDIDISKMCFCFGSNEAGIHGAGAAAYAHKQRGAIWGMGFGPMGTSWAIPTKDWLIHKLLPMHIEFYVGRFIRYAMDRPEVQFQMTQIGCGLAGYRAADIAPMFLRAPSNVLFDMAWAQWLPNHRFWGTG